MGIEDRLKRLEARAGLERQESEDDARRRRLMDKLYHVMENARCDLHGREPEPTPPELEDTKDDILHTLAVTIPRYRRHGGWKHGEGKAFLDQWEDRELEKLNELDELEKGNA